MEQVEVLRQITGSAPGVLLLKLDRDLREVTDEMRAKVSRFFRVFESQACRARVRTFWNNRSLLDELLGLIARRPWGLLQADTGAVPHRYPGRAFNTVVKAWWVPHAGAKYCLLEAQRSLAPRVPYGSSGWVRDCSHGLYAGIAALAAVSRHVPHLASRVRESLLKLDTVRREKLQKHFMLEPPRDKMVLAVRFSQDAPAALIYTVDSCGRIERYISSPFGITYREPPGYSAPFGLPSSREEAVLLNPRKILNCFMDHLISLRTAGRLWAWRTGTRLPAAESFDAARAARRIIRILKPGKEQKPAEPQPLQGPGV